jgi:kinesin family protein 5
LFKFDKVFGENTSQVQVFDEVKGVIGSVLGGFNGTIMAYGQTSAGKSFTMEGLSLWEGENQGLIPRCINLLFEEIAKSESSLQFQVVVSFYEVYCEKIRDLLNPQAVNLKLRETKENGFVVQDITEIFCTDRDSVMRVIEFGKTNRASAPTLMNAESSRSHSIVSILVDQKDTVSGRQRRGNLFLVDLAGSEKVSKTGASGMRLEEAKNINSSLTTLGMVINSLCDRAGHVPYRDSKLTMILMEALGGNSKTTLIICCTKESSQQSETVSTLRFGERAKKIQNHAKVNEELSVGELKALLAVAQKEIATLKKKLAAFRKSLKPGEMPELGLDDVGDEDRALDDEAVSDLRRQIEESSNRLQELQQDVDGLKSRLSLTEEELESERIRFQTEHEEKNVYFAENNALRCTIAELEEKLVKQSLEMKKAVAKSVEEAEKELEYDEATLSKELADVSELASAVDDGTASGDANRQRRVGAQSSSQDGATKKAIRAAILEKAEALEASLKAEAGDTSAPSKAAPAVAPASSDGVELNKFQQESIILNAQMEAEILALNQSVTFQAQEARNAMETAQKYADKYLKLREDYETHIERMMLKLTQEQQARTILEDQLESAMRKVFLFSKEIEKQRGGFFGWFSRKPTEFGNSASSSGRSKAANDREMGMARSLELANLRIQQLQSENDQVRESHGIVVETKESVINTLSKRVTELTNERDLFKTRMEDLTATVEQLTNLLRSTQNHSSAGSASSAGGLGSASSTGHFAPGMIKGGGSMMAGKNGGSMFINSSSLQMQQLMQNGNSTSRYVPNVQGVSAIRTAGVPGGGGTTASVASARTSSLGSDVDIDELLLNDDHGSIASSSSTDSGDSPPSVQTIFSATTQATNNTLDHNRSSGNLTRPLSIGRRPLPPLPPSQQQAANISRPASRGPDSDDECPLPSPPGPSGNSTGNAHAAGRPPIFPPSPSTAAALAATASLPSTMSSSIAQRMAGVMTRSRPPSTDKLLALVEPSSSSAANLAESNGGEVAAHRPTLNLVALSAGKVKRNSRPASPTSSSSAPPLTSTPTTPPNSNLANPGVATGGMSSFASRLTGVLDAPISSSGLGSANYSFGNVSSATSSTKRQSIGEMLLNGGDSSPAPK